MEELAERVAKRYDDLYMEIVYRAHHNSFKVSYADIFYSDFVNYIIKACGLKKKMLWKYLPKESTLKYMYKRRKQFFKYLNKPREKRRYRMFGDIKWSLDFWLSQLSFWHATVKAFTNVWVSVAIDNIDIPREVSWDEAITLYIIADFKHVAIYSNYKAVGKKKIEQYRKYIKEERKPYDS